ncbi:unnamed protein product, partial [Adineta ricciae]
MEMMHQKTISECSSPSNRPIPQRQKIDEPFLFHISNLPQTRERSMTQLNGKFVHSQVLMYRLLEIPSSANDTNKLITVIKQIPGHSSDSTTNQFNEFEQNYTKANAIQWYTKETPLYSYLNEALRTQNIDLIFSYGFFIQDIQEQLKEYQYQHCITVHRGQLISNRELQILRHSEGKLISINSFFSTSIDRAEAIFRLCLDTSIDVDKKRVLFTIDLNPAVVTKKPFADVSSLSDFSNEKEILIMLGSIFRIHRVTRGTDEEKCVYIIEMKLSGDNDHDLKSIIESIKADNGERDGESSLLLFGHALRDIGKFDDAQKYYEQGLSQLTVDKKKLISRYYHALGNAMDDKGDCNSSLTLFRKARHILRYVDDFDKERLARINISLGATYSNKGYYRQAIKSNGKALCLLIPMRDNNMNDHLIVMCLFNISEALLKMNH